MKPYTVGLVFTPDFAQVVLLHKLKPKWQVGKLNGMGGKVEDGETDVECMARECLEETCLDIAPDNWTHFATIINNASMGTHDAQVQFYAATYPGPTSDAKKGDYEEVEWFPVNALPDNVMQNLHFMIPMAREALRGHTAEITVRY